MDKPHTVEQVQCPTCGATYDEDGDEIGEDGLCSYCRPQAEEED